MAQPNIPDTFDDEEEEEGVYESHPVRRDDVIRADDKPDMTADLPAVGTASSLRAKFLSGQASSSTPRAKREITPPVHGTGGEFSSEPRTSFEQYEGKPEAGVFESEPEFNPDVVKSGSAHEEILPEKGAAKNLVSRFKEIEQTRSAVQTSKREITPERGTVGSGVWESEPTGIDPEVVRHGEGHEDALPEAGTAKNLASRYVQLASEQQSYSPRGKREITPDSSGKTEYTSEPRSVFVEEVNDGPLCDAGVFENEPSHDPNVVRSDSLVSDYEAEEYVPEQGFAKNIASRFKELESNAKSPPLSPGRRKEFTPPREEIGKVAGVWESNPEVKPEVVRSGESVEEKVPERGTAKNLAQRYTKLADESMSPSQPQRGFKEFTPPPADSGVFESEPVGKFQPDYNPPPESGILENEPMARTDVVKSGEPPKYEEELPERGLARNLLSAWKQKEAEGSKSPVSPGKVKEFTPPREEARVVAARFRRSGLRTPHTPKSPGGTTNGSVHPSELPSQYQPQTSNEPSVFESEPERLQDVYRENIDEDWSKGLPKKNTAQKMLAKFKKIEAASNSEAPVPLSRKVTNFKFQVSSTNYKK